MSASGNNSHESRVPALPESIALARSIVTAHLPPWAASESVAVARLLASEVVTNAIVHSGAAPTDSITLRTDVDDQRIRVEVEDPGAGFDWPDPLPAPNDGSGYGLHLVSNNAQRWGMRAGARPPTVVWFELPLGR
jgi:anti-sigma regulatory factor (Ser/Thr protein kinase)